ncbi:Nif3-like dinuclear metal center hexameric protein [Brachybacterium halotolerans subsp. kimchii]|uniref:Nif3-like dinuclear metal center hexameric protein n=1 Tax=Brachybacterium halotolerans TaxID=2795215 RepID=UPI001E3BCB5B|nr:Nif3-like dinuclear metal center hexameric protein [Brachybacterium halotolerans]UEJ83116.1 Nif3-like dinuclear metal center hexameric protein [Brachybacterium halotolerans subsp. kimchii]
MNGGDSGRPLAEVLEVLEGAYPLRWAEDWDRPGLVIGDRRDADPSVDRVHLAVDPTLAVVREARAAGAQLLVTHHPLLLRGASFLPADTGKGAVVTELVRVGMSLWCGHTNVDRSSLGTVGAWIRALGLEDVRPLAAGPTDGETAQAARGSELIGLGVVGSPADEVTEGALTVGSLAERIAAVVPETAQGVRFTGDPERPVRRVAVCPGAGDSLLEAAAASGADVFITSDLRHHPALEHLEAAADERAVPALIDVAHAASEALWLPLARDLLTAALPGIAVGISDLSTDPWTGRVDPAALGAPSGRAH